jgi:membrane protease YdiL (CAAX protease family)
VEHEFVTAVLGGTGIRSVTRTPSGIAVSPQPIRATTPFVVLVADADAPAAKEALHSQDASVDDVAQEARVDDDLPAERVSSHSEEPLTEQFPPSPWGGRDLLLGAAISAVLTTAFFFVWRESVIGDASYVVLDFVWTGGLLFGVLLPIWIVTVGRKGSMTDVFVQRVSPGIILFTVLGAFLFMVLDLVVWALVDAAFDVPSSNAYWWQRETPPHGLGLAGLAVTSVLVAPVIEEVLYRGILLRYFGSLLRPGFAATITAFLFAALHFQPVAIPSRFLFGVVAAGLVYVTRSLYPAVAFHMTLNAMSLLAFAGSPS